MFEDFPGWINSTSEPRTKAKTKHKFQRQKDRNMQLKDRETGTFLERDQAVIERGRRLWGDRRRPNASHLREQGTGLGERGVGLRGKLREGSELEIEQGTGSLTARRGGLTLFRRSINFESFDEMTPLKWRRFTV
jgi:hypothetical protein